MNSGGVLKISASVRIFNPWNCFSWKTNRSVGESISKARDSLVEGSSPAHLGPTPALPRQYSRQCLTNIRYNQMNTELLESNLVTEAYASVNTRQKISCAATSEAVRVRATRITIASYACTSSSNAAPSPRCAARTNWWELRCARRRSRPNLAPLVTCSTPKSPAWFGKTQASVSLWIDLNHRQAYVVGRWAAVGEVLHRGKQCQQRVFGGRPRCLLQSRQ